MKLFLIIALMLQATFIYSATVQDGGVFKIKPKGSALVLGIKDDSNSVGADLIAEADQSSNYQRFRMHLESGNNFYIEIVANGLYVSNFVSPPRQAGFNPNAFYQDYEFIPAAGGYYMIRPVANAVSVMTVAADGSLSWQPMTGADNQLFFLCSSSVIPTPALKVTALRSTNLSAAEDDGNYEGMDLKV